MSGFVFACLINRGFPGMRLTFYYLFYILDFLLYFLCFLKQIFSILIYSWNYFGTGDLICSLFLKLVSGVTRREEEEEAVNVT